MDTKMKTKRIEWLDDTKGLGILLIMMAHVFQYFAALHGINDYICSFHVPIFFIAAGYLTGFRKPEKISAARVKGLIVPYVIFSLINSAMKLGVLFLKKALTAEILKNEMVELFITGNGTVWFLLCLLLVELCYIGLLKMKVRDYGWLIIGVGLLVAVSLADNCGIPILVVLFRVIAGLGYYCIGYGVCGLHWEQKMKEWTVIVLIAAGILTEIFFGCEIAFSNGNFSNPVTMLICSICSSFGYMFLLEKLKKINFANIVKKMFSYFGKNSLIVMLVHPLLLQVVMYPLGSRIGQLQGVISAMAGIFVYVGLVVLEIPFIKIINGYFPFVLGRSKEK